MHRRHIVSRVCAGVCKFGPFIFCTHAGAQFSDAALPSTRLAPVVVTASRNPQRLSDALLATTSITRAEIEDSHAPDLATLLRGQAGIDVAQSGGLGSQTSLFVRGANSNQVLVLIDGLRVNAVGSGAASIAHLMIDQIDHVEIVRGNVSSLYGSEAIGGVIQIFTRGAGHESDEPSVGLNAESGGNRTRAASFDAAHAFGASDARTRVGLAASYRSARGFSAIDADRAPAANPDDDGYRNASVSAHVAQQFGAHEIGARYFESHGHLEFDDPTDYGFFGPPYNGRIQTHNERTRLTDQSLYGKFKPMGSWTLDLQAGQARDLNVNTSSYPASFIVGSTTSTDRQYRIGNTFGFLEHTATLAYEHLDQTGFSSSYGNGGGVDGAGAGFSRKVDSAMAGYTGPLFLPPLLNEFQLNARRDRYSDFGEATTGLAAYGLKFAPGWKAIVQASVAFKAPSFNELYFPFFGNPALKPERARTVEAGLQYAQDASFARISLFRTKTRDLIVFDPLLSLANNIDRARVTGLELSARTTVDGWNLSANLTFQRPIDEATRERLLRRANRSLGVTAAKSFGNWRVSADLQAAGARVDSDINTFARTELAGYAVANFGMRYQLLRGTTVGVAITNTFDKRYALVDGYNTAGRVTTVSLSTRY